MHSSATCFGFTEPSSGQYLVYGHATFSACVHYLHPIVFKIHFFLILLPSVKSIDRMYLKMYVKTPIIR